MKIPNITIYIRIFPLLLLLGCKGNEKDEWVQLPVARFKELQEVEISTIAKDPFKIEVFSNGKVSALQNSHLSFKISDRIRRIYHRNGDKVKKGEIIAELENELLLNDFEQAQVTLKKVSNLLMEQKILFGQGNKPDDQMDSMIRENLYLRTGYSEEKARLERAKILYRNSVLRAPYSGTLANITMKEGDWIRPDESFCNLIDYDRLEVVFRILETEVDLLRIGQKITISSFESKREKATGKIIEINPFVDQYGLITVKGQLEKSSDLFVGMNVKVIISSETEYMKIPKSAVVNRSNRSVIFSLENKKAKWNEVEIVDENSTFYGIESGLNIGDTIIISGNVNLSHNAMVQVFPMNK